MRWHHVIGWKGYYEVSDHGSIRSLTRIVKSASGPIRFKGRMLKAGCIEGNYPSVILSRPGKRVTMPVHIAVARAFIGRCPKGKEVCHRDGTRVNNHYKNIRYGTRKSNAEDRKLHGTNSGPPPRRGSLSGTAKLNEDQVLEILKSPLVARLAAEVWGVSVYTIHGIRQRRNWKHVKE